ncbi:family 10 glycosylhydrolase [candidate division KSB1 bacterium]|nr:family 10 glycosylhydrolase [candidate division KSB1 bacterium]
MLKTLICIFLLIFSLQIWANNNSEFRATWVITWDLINKYNSVDQNKTLCRQILDNHVKANMNAVLWQVRQDGTVYYKSAIEPWGKYAGYKNPGYDPLEYAIQEAHNRGLELHAWFNVFRCADKLFGSPAYEHPKWICTNQDGQFMTKHYCLSPGLKEVRDYLVKMVMEIVRNYDIDGIHFDYVRWNEFDDDDMTLNFTESEEAYPFDGVYLEKKFQKANSLSGKRFLYDVEHPYQNGVPKGFPTWADWRRWCVTEFVRAAHDSIQSLKPWVRLSAAALGRYRWDFEIGWDGYNTVYQDAALWFNEGYIEQLTPMHYHWLDPYDFYQMLAGPKGDSHYDKCWGYFIQPGIKAGRLFSAGPASYLLKDKNIWGNHVDLVKKARQIPWMDGFQFFSYAQWRDMKYWDTARELIFPQKVKIRSMGINEQKMPAAPAIQVIKQDTFVYSIKVQPTSQLTGWHYIYRVKGDNVDPGQNEIINIRFGAGAYAFTDRLPDGGDKFRYYATTTDRQRFESLPSNIFVSDLVPEKRTFPEPVAIQYVIKLENSYKIRWTPLGIIPAKGYRLYGKSGGNDWKLLIDEKILDASKTEVLVPILNSDASWIFTIRTVGRGEPPYESPQSDEYGIYQVGGEQYLIVDGFDRTNADGTEEGHPFAQRISESLVRLGISHQCCADDAIAAKLINLQNFQSVIWITGTENPKFQQLDYNEIARLATYLRNGGKLLISGSDLALNLGKNGDTSTQKFLKNYLKTEYRDDGTKGNGYQAAGMVGSVFDGLNFTFDNNQFGFNILKPDVLDTTLSSYPCLNYANGAGIAGIQHFSQIETSLKAAKVVTLGFPIGTVYPDASRDSLLARVIKFFKDESTGEILNTFYQTRNFHLYRNYPNPFNAETIIRFYIPEDGEFALSISNLLGQEVAKLGSGPILAGEHSLRWAALDQPSGIYFIQLTYKRPQGTERQNFKMMLLK